jgi:hypothetical protein
MLSIGCREIGAIAHRAHRRSDSLEVVSPVFAKEPEIGTVTEPVELIVVIAELDRNARSTVIGIACRKLRCEEAIDCLRCNTSACHGQVSVRLEVGIHREPVQDSGSVEPRHRGLIKEILPLRVKAVRRVLMNERRIARTRVRWLHNFGRCGKWNFCLTTGTLVPANQERQ